MFVLRLVLPTGIYSIYSNIPSECLREIYTIERTSAKRVWIIHVAFILNTYIYTFNKQKHCQSTVIWRVVIFIVSQTTYRLHFFWYVGFPRCPPSPGIQGR